MGNEDRRPPGSHAIQATTIGAPAPRQPTTPAMPQGTPQPGAPAPGTLISPPVHTPRPAVGRPTPPPQQAVQPGPRSQQRPTPATPVQQTQFGTGRQTPPAFASPMVTPQGHLSGPRGNQLLTGASDGGHVPAGIGHVDELVPGMRIHQYELMRELGRGGMGAVFAARDTRLGRRVAIKFLLNASRAIAERFLVEARATAQCSHENIVIIHEVDELGDMPYMVLEFLEGSNLRDMLGEHGGVRLSPQRVVELMLPVARALARAHELGIVHRDLKPENVFVTSSGQVKVLDFGIAKALGANEGEGKGGIDLQQFKLSDMSATRAGTLLGTPPYMSPEQLTGGVVDHRSDLWACGIMMWEMLVGRHPVEPLTMDGLVNALLVDDGPMPRPSQFVGGVDEGLDQLVAAALEKSSDNRLAAAKALVARLEALTPGRRGRQLGEGESPFPGLHAFQEADADRFFGRDRDVARTAARLRELPLLGIIGPSGVGKSSFVRAGVGPALKASGEPWEVVTVRPGRNPLAALASILHRMGKSSPSMSTTGQGHDPHHALIAQMHQAPGTLGDQLRQRARERQCNILLFVDQFEELYTLAPSPEERLAFTNALTGVADDVHGPLRVVVSMRSDFLDRVAEDTRFSEELSRGLIFLAPPDRAGLREALVAPVEMVGHRYESEDIVTDMLDGLGQTAGALPLLQFAAAKLWDVRDRDRKMLTLSSYKGMGGVTGALAAHADEVIAHMDQPTRRLTQRIMRKLVTEERTRAVVELEDLVQLSGDRGAVQRVIDQLVGARLLTVQAREGGGTVEIVHESLITSWPTLRAWLDEEQEDAAFVAQLATAAKQWDAKGRPTGMLWRGEAIDEARRWYKARPRELGERDHAFLDAGFSLAKRGARRKRFALVLTFLVLAAGGVGAFVAYLQVRMAQAETVEKEKEARLARDKAEAALAAAEEKEKQRLAAEEKKRAAEEEKKAADRKVAAQAGTIEEQNRLLAEQLAEARALEAAAKAAAEQARKAMKDAQEERAKATAANQKLQIELEKEKAKAKAAGTMTNSLKK